MIRLPSTAQLQYHTQSMSKHCDKLKYFLVCISPNCIRIESLCSSSKIERIPIECDYFWWRFAAAWLSMFWLFFLLQRLNWALLSRSIDSTVFFFFFFLFIPFSLPNLIHHLVHVASRWVKNSFHLFKQSVIYNGYVSSEKEQKQKQKNRINKLKVAHRWFKLTDLGTFVKDGNIADLLGWHSGWQWKNFSFFFGTCFPIKLCI